MCGLRGEVDPDVVHAGPHLYGLGGWGLEEPRTPLLRPLREGPQGTQQQQRLLGETRLLKSLRGVFPPASSICPSVNGSSDSVLLKGFPRTEKDASSLPGEQPAKAARTVWHLKTLLLPLQPGPGAPGTLSDSISPASTVLAAVGSDREH